MFTLRLTYRSGFVQDLYGYWTVTEAMNMGWVKLDTPHVIDFEVVEG